MRPSMAASPPNKYGTGECHVGCGGGVVNDDVAAVGAVEVEVVVVGMLLIVGKLRK